MHQFGKSLLARVKRRDRIARRVIILDRIIRTGSWRALEETGPGAAGGEAQPGIVLGQELAKQLGLTLGDAVSVVSPLGEVTPLGRTPKVPLAECEDAVAETRRQRSVRANKPALLRLEKRVFLLPADPQSVAGGRTGFAL